MLVLKVFLACLALHFFSDFTLQGLLAQLKCQDWWKKNYPEPLYRNDWLCGLIEHAVYWVLVTAAPIIWLWRGGAFALVFLLATQAALHAWIDHWKANKHDMSLSLDQILHVVQIGVIVSVWYGTWRAAL